MLNKMTSEVSSDVIVGSLSILGDRWTLLIIHKSFLRTCRFNDFQKQLGIARHLLAERLTRLVDNHIFEKIPYQEAPKRFEYHLTERGRALYPIIFALAHWGNNWMNNGSFAKIEYVHQGCGKKTLLSMTCSTCGEALIAHDMLADLEFDADLPFRLK